MTRIAVRGEIDLSNAADLQARIEAGLNGAGRSVLDLRDVTFMGSEGVRLIYKLSSSLENRELVVLVEPEGIPDQVLRMTRMHERVILVSDLADIDR